MNKKTAVTLLYTAVYKLISLIYNLFILSPSPKGDIAPFYIPKNTRPN